MSKQTRRAISVKGLTYQRLKTYCDVKELSISGYLEKIVNKKLDDLGIPEETILIPHAVKPKLKAKRKVTMRGFTGSHHTF